MLEYADSGQDIVCAAASVLVINTMNSIEEFTEDDASLISDDETVMISYHLNHPSKDAQAFAEFNDSWSGTDGR